MGKILTLDKKKEGKNMITGPGDRSSTHSARQQLHTLIDSATNSSVLRCCLKEWEAQKMLREVPAGDRKR